MVRILANGEIVQDDDPRVRTTTQPRSSTPRQSFLSRGHGAPLGGPGPRQQQAGARLGAAQSPFNDLNRQLVNMGFPQWHLGNHAVEPVTSILLLFLLMMLGEDPGDLDDLGVLAGGTVNVVPWRHLVEFPCRSMTSIPPSNHPPSCTGSMFGHPQAEAFGREMVSSLKAQVLHKTNQVLSAQGSNLR
ncbi:protein FAM241B isoform X7 [Vicugna pacos]|uniref:Protein FAM241B isoform X7 n=1 Tax=Vicugna pacos TaxID=30538 RepID=A0ABM5E2W0_VICPA